MKTTELPLSDQEVERTRRILTNGSDDFPDIRDFDPLARYGEICRRARIWLATIDRVRAEAEERGRREGAKAERARLVPSAAGLIQYVVDMGPLCRVHIDCDSRDPGHCVECHADEAANKVCSVLEGVDDDNPAPEPTPGQDDA